MNQRTGWDIAREIAALIWYTLLMYIYTVATIVLVIWGIYKIIVYRQQVRELSNQIERRQVQVQQQNTNVIVQSNKKPSIEHTSANTTSCAMEMLTFPCTSAKRTVETCFICNEQGHGGPKCPMVARVRALTIQEHNSSVGDESGTHSEDTTMPDEISDVSSKINETKANASPERSRSWSRKDGGRLTRSDSSETIKDQDQPFRGSRPESVVRFKQEHLMQRANEGSGDYEVNFNDENEREFRRYQNQRPDRIIQVNAASTINYPPPIKFSKDVNVHDWIKEVELYIELTGVRDKNKTVFWAYLDADTRKLLSDIVFDEEDGIATVQIKRRLVELFGQRQKGTLDLIKEFSERKQRQGENVRIYCLELQTLCKRAFTDCLNHERYIIDQFIEGVGNKQLQLNLSSNKPASVNQMLDVATKYEEAFHRQNERSERNRNESAGLQNRQIQNTSSQNQNGQFNQQQNRRANACFECGGMDHIKANCPKRVQAPNNDNNNGRAQTSQAAFGHHANPNVNGV